MFELGFGFTIGLDSVLLLGTGVCSLPLLTQALLELAAAPARVPAPDAFAPVFIRSYCRACAAIVFLPPRRTVRWFLFIRRVFGSKLDRRVFAT